MRQPTIPPNPLFSRNKKKRVQLSVDLEMESLLSGDFSTGSSVDCPVENSLSGSPAAALTKGRGGAGE